MRDSLENLALSSTFTIAGGHLRQIEEHSFTRASRPLPVTIDGKYKLLSLLGEGGMGAVYKAHHILLDKYVALKMIRTATLSEEAWERFVREAKAVVQLDNAHVVRVFDFGTSEGNQPYYTMEMLSGESLAERLQKRGALTVDETLAIVDQIAQGLVSAHKRGIVHRDLKPANIFIETSGRNELIKIVDFGLAKLLGQRGFDDQRLTATGTVFGSPLYMSPEQSVGDAVDERSDIYSLGCTVFEMLTGKPPFIGPNAFATIYMHQSQEAPSLNENSGGLEFPQWLDDMVAAMLIKDTAERTHSAREIIDTIARGKTKPAGPDDSREKRTDDIDPSLELSTDRTQADSDTELGAEEKAKMHSIWFKAGMAAVAVALCGGILACILAFNTAQSTQNVTKPAPLTKPSLPFEPNNLAPAAADEFLFDEPRLTADVVAAKLKNGKYKQNNGKLSLEDMKLIAAARPSSLDLERNILDNDGFKYFVGTPLEKLTVSEANIDDNGAVSIAQCNRLLFLRISYTHLTSNGLNTLCNLKNLRVLIMDGMPVQAATIAKVSTMQQLGKLSMASCKKLGVAELAPIAKTRVTDLDVSGSELLPGAGEAIASIKTLEHLNLNGTAISINELDKICSGPRALEAVEVAKCPKLTPGALRTLAEKYPRIKIISEDTSEFDNFWNSI